MSLSYDLDAERAVLGGCMIDPLALDSVSEILSGPGDFYRDAHAEIYTAMMHLHEDGRGIDMISVCDALRQQHKLELAGGAAYMDSLIEAVSCSAHIEGYAQIVADTAVQRRLYLAGQEIASISGDTADDVAEQVARATAILDAVDGGKKGATLAPIGATIDGFFQEIYDAAVNGRQMMGLSTGWPELDDIITGLQPGQLVIIGARPAMGKTAFALELAKNTANAGACVAVFSLEMSRDELQKRLLCSTARVNGQDITRGALSNRDWHRIAAAVEEYRDTCIYIDDTAAMTVSGMKARLRRLQRTGDLGLVIIDYLQLVQGSARYAGGGARVQEVSEITRALKIMAKELEVPVVVLSQLSRNLESRQDKRPMLADLRESGSIEQDADVVVFLYRDAYYNPGTGSSMTEVIVAKQRSGPTGTATLQFSPSYGAFTSPGIAVDSALLEQQEL